MSPARTPLVLLSALGLLATAPGAASAAPPPRDASAAVLRAYVASGGYLADVADAAAPAQSALLARVNEIDAQRAACSAVGRSSLRAATPAPATAGRTTGAVRIVFKAGPLRAAKARVGALGAARRLGRTLRLDAASTSFAPGRATVVLQGDVRLRRGAGSVTLRSLRLTATRTATTLSARVGSRRVDVLRTAGGGARIDAASGRLRVASASASLPAAGARALRASGLAAGRVAVLSADVRRTGSTPSTPAPSPTTPATPATPATTTTTPATTTTIPAPTPTPPAPTFDPTPAACALIPRKPAIVLDIDETAMSNYLGRAGQAPFAGDPGGGSAGQFPPAIAGRDIALAPVKAIYDLATARGVAAFFVTARPPIIRPQTLSNLTEQGYGASPQVTFKADVGADSGTFKRDARRAIEAQGYTVIQDVGDQCTDIFGDAAGTKVKIPNPFYLSGGTGAPAEDEQDSEVCGALQ